jgi:RNA-directed DNA polymerase
LERQDVGEKKKSVRFTIPKEAKKDYKEKIRTATSGSHDVSVRAKIRALNAVVRGWGNYYRYATDAARRFSELDHFTWRRTMGWLTEKFQSKTEGVVANRLDSTAPITMNGRSLVRLNSVGSAIYRESFKKDGHPYLTEAVGEGEDLPEDDPWLGNAEEKLGMEDQRWKALERSDWTCRECGRDLKEVQAEVHHKTPYSRYDNPEEANRLENLMSLCRRCHQEIESNRTLAK